MAASRGKASPQSSPAGEEGYDEPFSDDDLCGYGCHGDGVAPGAISAGCEHGTYKVTETTKRKAVPVSGHPQTVHDRDLHHAVEEASSATDAVVGLVNGHDERILTLETQVRSLQATVETLVEHIAGGTAAEETDPVK